ncbi:hypothetical protein JKP88DRAFT_287740 [Tribonema minus]|uniref:Uncharacterized protein n=1 Tax=Tribonema minus TaxID=303371 RepID=A0A835Z9G7_9STRA|nr:hypothetical protein JKP88DRAFT_287740 [Tribonema minus]
MVVLLPSIWQTQDEAAPPAMRRAMNQVGPSLLCGYAGYHCVAALFSKRVAADAAAAAAAAQTYVELSGVAADPRFDADEFLYGRAGYLYGMVALRRELGEAAVPLATMSAVAGAIVASGRAYVREGRLQRRGHLPPMFWEWHAHRYVGAAHGAMGILHALLLCPAELWGSDDTVLRSDDTVLRDIGATMDFLLSLWQPGSANFPAALQADAKDLVHWCHGATGAVFAFSTAYCVLGHQRYLDAAILAGETVWRRGLLKKGPGLCHGVAGNAYALLALFRVTRDAKYLRRAHRFAEFMGSSDFAQVTLRPDHPYSLFKGLSGAAAIQRSVPVALRPDHPYSLFEGLSGAACLYADLVRPEDSRFPLFEL